MYINDTAGTGYTAAITIPQIGTHGTRAGVQGITTIGNANTGTVTFGSGGHQFSGGQMLITSGGDIITPLDANITSDDNIKLDLVLWRS